MPSTALVLVFISGASLLLLVFSAAAGEITLMSFLAVVLQSFWNLSNSQAAAIFSSIFAGQILGTLVLGTLADHCGRRPIFLATSAFITLFGFLSAVGNSFGLFIFFRLMVGAGIGGVTIPFDMLAEVAPEETRGRDLMAINFFWAGGELLIILLAFFTLGEDGNLETKPNGWRWMVILAAAPVLVSALLGYFCVPESPRWLVAKGRQDEALEILRKAATVNGRDPDELFPIGTKFLVEEKESSDPRDLFKPAMRKLTFLIWVLYFTLSATFAGIVLFSTIVFSDQGGDAGDSTSYSFQYDQLAINTSAEFFLA